MADVGAAKMVSDEDRAAWLAAAAAVDAIEAKRSALLAPTARELDRAQARLEEVEERTGPIVCTCEACSAPVFEGEPWMGGETPLCGTCSPTYADLLAAGELSGFVHLNADDEYEPMTAEQPRALYDAHVAAGGLPTDSMATP